MEPLNNYLTKDAWKRDLNETKKDITDFLNDDRGEINKKGLLLVFGGAMTYFGLTNLAVGRYGWALIDFAFAGWNFHTAYQMHRRGQ